MGILIQTTALVYVFPYSLSLGVSTRVGNELGANRPAKARTAAIVSLLCAVLLGLTAMVFTTSVRHRWGRLFTDDAEILELTAVALPIAGLCELGNCPQTTGCGVLRGSARPSTGANINLASFYVVGMPVAVLLGFVAGFGFPGLWLGLLAAQASCAACMALALAKTDWLLEVERARLLTISSSSSNSTATTITAGFNDNNGNKVGGNGETETRVGEVVKNVGCLEEILCINVDDEKKLSLETHPLLIPHSNTTNTPLLRDYPQLRLV
ncbi:hypothetical protein J5N97_024666 [Dioscorea zingiberensis]|uniref:Uncharacterized protein n=1 Tax=Dioscorea zingiberensis TaxID=325984 RepID=A0A9D5C7E0_9LILI|nr:hypothetical protein J5N97_024666 [Dioscorea zingiberensis]